MRLIDADALKRRAITVRFFGKNIMMVPTAEIDDAPTIDAVEVVRCKDCRYWQDQEEGIVECPICTRIHDMVFEMGADGFCSYGERKGGGEK